MKYFILNPKTGNVQHISLPNPQQRQTKLTEGQTQAASCKAREEHIPVMANKVVFLEDLLYIYTCGEYVRKLLIVEGSS